MKLKYSFVVRSVGDRMVAVAVGKEGAAFNGMIKLNESGAFLFDQLKEETTRENVIACMMEKYEMSADEAAGALDAFLDSLRQNDLLIE